MQDTSVDFSSSFGGSSLIMQLLGFYPAKKHESSHRIYAYVLYVVSMVPTFVFGSLHFFFHQDGNTTVYNDFIVVAMVFYAVKYWPCVKNSRGIYECIHYFDEKFFAEFKPKHQEIMGSWGKICRRNSNVFIGGNVGCAVCWLIGVLPRDELPLTVWLPFVPDKHSLVYWCVYGLQVLVVLYATLACSVIDPLVGSLACLATGQLQVLKDNLQHLTEYTQKESSFSLEQEKKSEKIYDGIKTCARHYQEIVKFVKLYEQCFSSVALTELMESILIIGCCCLQISLAKQAEDIIIWSNGLLVVFLQIFLYCYYGTGLMEENSTLNEAIFMSDWYEYDVRCQKMLIMIMERSKRPMIASAGKVLELSLQTLMTILKRSYSFSAILRNYY